MLKVKTHLLDSTSTTRHAPDEPLSIVRGVVDFFLVHRRSIMLSALAGLVLGGLAVARTPPQYTATSTLLIDDNKVDLFQRPSVVFDQVTDNGFVESQIEVIRSQTVAREVVRMAGLLDKPPQQPKGIDAWLTSHGLTPGQIKARLFRAIGLTRDLPAGDAAPSEDDREGEIADELLNSVNVKRVGLTYVVTVSVTAGSPTEAQTLANAFPEAYVATDQTAKQASTKRAIVWLDDRLKELRQKGAEADQAVENFRRDRALNGTDRGLVSSQLRQLESTALSYKNLYDSLQTRYLQAVQEQSFITTKARVIGAASPPTSPSAPRISLILAAGLMLGFVGGVGLSLLGEALKRPIRSAAELEAASGLECLAVLERVRRSSSRLVNLLLPFRTPPQSAMIRYVVQHPFTGFSEELRRLSITLRQRRTSSGRSTILGVVSLNPNEGKTTISSNLAQTLGLSGSKTLLVDMDLRNPRLTEAYDPPSSAADIFDVAEKQLSIWHDPQGHTDFMTGAKRIDLSRDGRIFESAALEKTFQRLSPRYEFIVLDLPPLRAVADADALKHLVDAFMLVVSSDDTSAELVSETLNRFDPQRTQLVGAVLNNAQVRKATDYHSYYIQTGS